MTPTNYDDIPEFQPLPNTEPCAILHHEKGCRWPVTSNGNQFYCNEAVKEGVKTYYCNTHHNMAWRPAMRRKRGAKDGW